MICNVKLLKKENIAEGSMAFYFERPEGFVFTAGQWSDYTLIDPPETDAEGNVRGFSFVNAPYEDDLVVAMRMRDTAFKRVLGKLPIGTSVKLDGPHGDFRLHKAEATPAVFLIGGIGVTPVRSMIAQALHDKTSRQLTLVHANRKPSEAPFAVDFERFAREHANFKYTPVAEEVPVGWTGERGRIDQAMLKRCVLDLNAPIFYLSGPEGMVKAMRQLLVTADVDEDKIKTEEFSGY